MKTNSYPQVFRNFKLIQISVTPQEHGHTQDLITANSLILNYFNDLYTQT